MNKIFIGLAALLITTPAMSHPRIPKTSWKYSYPEKDVMVRRDWESCKKIKYVTKYDRYGWYTERQVTPLRSCWNWKSHTYGNTWWKSDSGLSDGDVKLRVIIKN
tara:strand:- start:779 stop:1093 length:315 start_codon:yes stop_codon:yes gene_type:complete